MVVHATAAMEAVVAFDLQEIQMAVQTAASVRTPQVVVQVGEVAEKAWLVLG
jgi:flavin-binding protein dodecin